MANENKTKVDEIYKEIEKIQSSITGSSTPEEKRQVTEECKELLYSIRQLNDTLDLLGDPRSQSS